MKRSELKIDGMNCQHCVRAVKTELLKIPLLTLEDVQIGSAAVTYDETQIQEIQLYDAIENAGFTLIAIQ